MGKKRKAFCFLLFSAIPSLFLLVQIYKNDDLSLISTIASTKFLLEFLNSSNLTTSSKASPYAFVVLMKNEDNVFEYEFAQKTVKCYCESRRIPYYLIVNDEWNTRGCPMHDYMYQRHCILANFMNKTEHEWFVMLDADMGVINPDTSIDKFIPANDSVFLVLTNRVMNAEIMTGSYLVRNDPRGQDFLMMWARSLDVYAHRFGSDNAAVHSAIVRKYLPELEAELSKCESWWKSAKHYCRLFLYEVCVRNLLDKHEIPGIQFLKKTYSYVRDGWLTGGKFSDEDFIFHNWKKRVKNNRGTFGWWDYQFTDDAFNNLSYCQSGEEAYQLWRYKPDFRVTVAENRKTLDDWVKRTKKERDRQMRLSMAFNVNTTKNCD